MAEIWKQKQGNNSSSFCPHFSAFSSGGSGHKKILGLPRILLRLTDETRLAADERLVVVGRRSKTSPRPDVGSDFQTCIVGYILHIHSHFQRFGKVGGVLIPTP